MRAYLTVILTVALLGYGAGFCDEGYTPAAYATFLALLLLNILAMIFVWQI